MNERKIFQEALDYSDPAQRQAYLDRACGNDTALRARIEALLRSHNCTSLFLKVPAPDQIEPAGDRPPQTIDLSEESAPCDGDPDDAVSAASDLSFLNPSSKSGSFGILGHYEILQQLGRGAFGVVFKAFDEKLHREVAIKVMNPQLAATSPPRKRFLREARSAAAIKHENVVQVYSVEEQPLPYLVMEFVDGMTLKEKLDHSGPLDIHEILHLGRQMASGLAAAHGQGLIHRDIKPGNILIESRTVQKVKITDFGLARAADDATLTRTGVISGTPMYMAPEQAQGLALDHRADLFSLGSVLYQMTSGRPPFRGPSTIAVLKRVVEETPRSIREIIPEVPEWLCAVITKLHAKDPNERFQSAKEVAELLARCQASLQQIGRVELSGDLLSFLPKVAVTAKDETPFYNPTPIQSSIPERNQSPRRRHWATAAAMVMVLLAGIGMTEATGVTNVRGTVIRLFSPEGTLVVEVDDPGVSVSIDGEEMIITGTGAKEIRLKPGQYKILASKDGKLVSQELVTVLKNGRQVVRVSRDEEPAQAVTNIDPDRKAAEWVLSIGGVVRADDPSKFLNRIADLPKDRFTLTAVILRNNSQVSNSGLAKLMPLSGLVELILDGGNITDAGLVQLKDLNKLKYLSFRGTKISDTGLAHLKNLNALQMLWLDGTTVSDAGLVHLQQLTNLRSLDVRSTRVTPKGVADLHVTLPDLRIEHDGGVIEPRVSPALERKSAEWVLSNGGRLQIGPGGNVSKIEQLPKEDFWVLVVSLSAQISDEDIARINHFPQANALYFGQSTFTNEGLAKLTNCRFVKVLSLDSTKVTDAGLTALKNFPELTNLGIHNTLTTDAAIEHIKQCKKLTDLDLSLTGISDTGLKSLGELKNLQSVNVFRTKVSAGTVSAFAKAMPQCKICWDGGVIEPTSIGDPDRKVAEWVLSEVGGSIRIDGQEQGITSVNELPKQPFKLTMVGLNPQTPKQPTNEGLAQLKFCQDLKAVHLNGPLVNDSHLVHLQHFKNLTDLQVTNTTVTDLGLANFKDCKRLTQLVLSGTRVTDFGLEHFKDCKNLVDLHLYGTLVSDAGMVHFKDCKILQSLILNGTQVSDTGLMHFKDCRLLYKLELNGTKVTDAGMVNFKNCTLLNFIELAETQVSGSGLVHFKDCKRPHIINLTGTPINDDGLKELAKVTKLVSTNLKKTKVTAAGIDALKKALPQCIIDWDGGLINPTKSETDPDRKAAEWVLSIPREFQVLVQVNDVDRWIGKVTDLPAGPFRLTGVNAEWASKLDDAGLTHFQGCKHLKRLQMVGTQVTEKGLATFKDCQDLEKLGLIGDSINDRALEIFKGCKRLTTFEVTSKNVTDDGLAHFQGSDKLTLLGITHSPVTDKGLLYFKDNKKLKSLNLGATLVTDAGLAQFAECKELEVLLLFRTQVTDAGLAHVADCKKLQTIDLNHMAQITDASLAYLKGCPELKQLNFCGTLVGNDGLAYVKNWKDLAFLQLDSTKVTDAGLVHLKDCKLLGDLSLAHTRLTGPGLVHLKDCTSLSRLILVGTGLTDESIGSLSDLRGLRILDLQKTRLTAAGIKKLIAALPQCSIVSDHGTFGPGKK